MRASVVIPYYQRRKHLEKVLIALQKQSLNKDEFEVIVVNDGSTFQSQDFQILISKLITTEHSGAAAARNTGLSQATGDVIIFLDSDIVVEPTFIEKHCLFHETHKKMVCLGPRLHTNATEKEIQTIDTRLKLLKRYKKKVSELSNPWFMAYTCNISVPRRIAQKEPFDTNFKEWGLEDIEWAYRLHRCGYAFAFLEEAIGIHLYHDRTMTREKFDGWERNLKYTISKHPELSTLQLFTDVFNPSTAADYFERYDIFEELSCLPV